MDWIIFFAQADFFPYSFSIILFHTLSHYVPRTQFSLGGLYQTI